MLLLKTLYNASNYGHFVDICYGTEISVDVQFRARVTLQLTVSQSILALWPTQLRFYLLWGVLPDERTVQTSDRFQPLSVLEIYTYEHFGFL